MAATPVETNYLRVQHDSAVSRLSLDHLNNRGELLWPVLSCAAEELNRFADFVNLKTPPS
jgi:hypothetical protein